MIFYIEFWQHRQKWKNSLNEPEKCKHMLTSTEKEVREKLMTV
jgi:hypothetical protein